MVNWDGAGRQSRYQGQKESLSPGCLQEAASSRQAEPLSTSHRLKCFRNTESSFEYITQPQSRQGEGSLKSNTGLTHAPAHTMPPPGQHTCQVRYGPSVHLPPSLFLQACLSLSPHFSNGSSTSKSFLSSLFCSSSSWTHLLLCWSK